MKILVGYATGKGSTCGVAERIAIRLRSAGHVADIHTAAQPPDPGEYDAVVLGSAIHNGEWLPEAAEHCAVTTSTTPAEPAPLAPHTSTKASR